MPWHFLSRVLLFSLCFALAGCGTRQKEADQLATSTNGERWLSLPVHIRVDSDLIADSGAVQDLNDAIRFWQSKAGREVFVLADPWPHNQLPYGGPATRPEQIIANALYLQSPWPFDPNIAGKTILHARGSQIEAGLILLNSDVMLCAGDCSLELNRTSRRKLLAHEFGHYLGLNHVSDKQNIMYPEIQPGGTIDDLLVDQGSLIQLVN